MSNKQLCFMTSANSVHSDRWVGYFTKNYNVTWLSFGIDAAKTKLNTRFYFIKKFPIKLLRPIMYLIATRKILKQIKPDILHTHQVWIDGLMGVLSGFHPIVITPWGSDILIVRKIKRPIISFVLKRADLLTCDGENTKKAMIELGVDEKKIKIICFGVDVELFKPQPKDEVLKKRLDLGDSPVVISLRSLKQIYDVGTLIRAVPVILKHIPHTKFVIAGDGEEKEALINLAKALNIYDAVRFVGKVSSEEMAKYLNLGDVYTSTALSDSGLAASTAEAMACGLPVVITDSGDNRRWVKDGQNGFVVSKKDFVGLAEKIIHLLSNKETGKTLGENNRKIIAEKNNYYREMKKMDDIYQELIRAHSE